MLKKILVVILAVMIAASLAACGDKKQEETTPETTTPAETTTAETTPAETTPAETTTQEETTPEETAVPVPEVPEGIVVPDEMLTEAKEGTVSVDGDVLTLRQGPASTYDGIDAVPDGTVLTIEGEQDGWGFVNYNDQYGWVSLDFVE